MDSAAEEAQQLEITALQSIYADDFIDVPPPTAWKGAPRLPEFIIRVFHPDPVHAQKLFFHLHVKFPKTYPRLACPIFAIQKPIKGLSDVQVTKLAHEVNLEAQKLRGFEMVFNIITFCQDWIEQNVTIPVEVVGSLALQMNQRAREEERARRQRELEESEQDRAERSREEKRLKEEIDRENAHLQALIFENEARRGITMSGRKRANSEATEVPGEGEYMRGASPYPHAHPSLKHGLSSRPHSRQYGGAGDGYGSGTEIGRGDYDLYGDESYFDGTDPGAGNGAPMGVSTMVEVYGGEIKIGEIGFWSVKLYNPRVVPLGVLYNAEPITDPGNIPLLPPLEQYVVTFEDPYYSTSGGRKKLRQLEEEIQKLTIVKHTKLLRVFAVKLILVHTPPSGSGGGSDGGQQEAGGMVVGSLGSTGSAGAGAGASAGDGMTPGAGNGPGSTSVSGPTALPRVYAQLMVLSEQPPPLTLYDVLEDCESLREDKAVDYLIQILTALQAIHLSDLVHRGISAKSIGLAHPSPPHGHPNYSISGSSSTLTSGSHSYSLSHSHSHSHNHSQHSYYQQQKTIKLLKTSYPTRLLDLHRSNPFGPGARQALSGSSGAMGGGVEDMRIPDSWLSRDVQNESSLLYTRKRDIHAVGIVFLQMLMGLDVVERFPDAEAAIHASPISPVLAKTIMTMLNPTKKNGVSCASLLGELSDTPKSPTTGFRIPQFMHDTRTPLPPALAVGSPDADYFRGAMTQPTPRAITGVAPVTTAKPLTVSRWKEDWEELELLGRGGFGSVVKARNKIDGRIYAVKKIRLRTNHPSQDAKIWREVNALSSLSHRNIVRYYTTWVETIEAHSSSSFISSDSSISGEDGVTSVPSSAVSIASGDSRSFEYDDDDEDDDAGFDHLDLTHHDPLGYTNAQLSPTHGRKGKGKSTNDQARPINGGFLVTEADFDDVSAISRSSFPSLWFGDPSKSGGSSPASQGDEESSSSEEEDEEEDDEEDEEDEEDEPETRNPRRITSGKDEDDHADTESSDEESEYEGLFQTPGAQRSALSIASSQSQSQSQGSTSEGTTASIQPSTSMQRVVTPGQGGAFFKTPPGNANAKASGSGHGQALVGGMSASVGVPIKAGPRPLVDRFDDFDPDESPGAFGGRGYHLGGGGRGIEKWNRKMAHKEKERKKRKKKREQKTPGVSKILYIQMEFVERQTLKERIEENLTESEAWTLFLQIVDALVHMSTLGILHRDIKLTNIFIDSKGDCKVGDFGLATSSLAAVDPSDVAAPVVVPEADMTLEVGTRLYIAPEVQSRRKGVRDHSKADMYSLGIVFFEMNYRFSTGAERISVLEDLRKPGIFFPSHWDQNRKRQRDIITWLLQHAPEKRPTALELSQSPLLPPRVEDEYFNGALQMMSKSTPYRQMVLNSLFKQVFKRSRAFLYDKEVANPGPYALDDKNATDPAVYASLTPTVTQRLSTLFHLHGAVNVEPPLLMPVMDVEDERSHASFLDRKGDLVMLPRSLWHPMARLAAHRSTERIKRYFITNIYEPRPVSGHPKHIGKAAMFDILTPDFQSGPVAASAEMLVLVNECLDSFPNLNNYEIHVSHSRIVELVMNRVPDELKSTVADLLHQSRMDEGQRRGQFQSLQKKGLMRSQIEELDTLSEITQDIDSVLSRLQRGSPTLLILMKPALDELKETITLAQTLGVRRSIFFHGLMVRAHHEHCKDGVLLEVVKKTRHTDVLAFGGRYDGLISRLPTAVKGSSNVCAVGVQIMLDKITEAVGVHINTSIKKSHWFGFWSPRRCDVYVISYQPGHLQERLEIVAHLWQHNISADAMYETGVSGAEHENYGLEGILFTVYPRPRSGRNQAAFKVRSILNGTEVELSRQELVPWLQQNISEQKRIDAASAGAFKVTDVTSTTSIPNPTSSTPNVQVIVPDAKKQRKPRQIYGDKAYEKALSIKSAFQSGVSVLAVDISTAVFDAMIAHPSWVSEDDTWKTILAMFPPQQSAYAQSIREAAAKRKAEGHAYILLYAVRDDRAQILTI